MITAHGKAYETIEQAREMITVLQQENAQYGASDGRVTEILLLEEAIAAAAPVAERVYEVVKDSYEIPCDHPACAILHRRLAKEPFADGGTHWVDVYHNGRESRVQTNRWHNLVREYWVVLLDGERVGDTYATKREALAEMARLQRTA